jgi:hypothetical protein
VPIGTLEKIEAGKVDARPRARAGRHLARREAAGKALRAGRRSTRNGSARPWQAFWPAGALIRVRLLPPATAPRQPRLSASR